ncbi:MAG TPA: methyltransferase domain-containing protein [Microthrixaceae bacterium]|nr:class I SAM-dependent methyltransferase [Acidimicrobiales bacterium]HRW39945.1 methyltransferase domain-containing protein [Microthrixaceae bacterium]
MTPQADEVHAAEPLAYFDLILADFDAGRATRHAHLGHWDDPIQRPTTIQEVHAAQHRMAEILVDLLDLRDGHRFLDVGCGLGGTVELVIERGLEVHAIGVNIDPRQLDRCRTLEPGSAAHIDWVLGDGVHLALADSSIDRLLCLEALPHLSSRRAFFAEAQRVLRPGGVLVVTDVLVAPGAAAVLGVEPAELAARIDQILGPWPEPLATLDEVRAVASSAGFRETVAIDATVATAPSHALSFEGVDLDAPHPWSEVLLGEQVFSRLHAAALIECHYLAFVLDQASA